MRTRPIATIDVRPALPRHVRLRWDPVREAWSLLSPEKVLWPDETSLAILQRCDGVNSVSAIVDALASEYEAEPEEVRGDVLAFVQDWSDRMVLRF
jgi:pyrroloquinoline quinone biosynthesis protein D